MIFEKQGGPIHQPHSVLVRLDVGIRFPVVEFCVNCGGTDGIIVRDMVVLEDD